MKVETNDGDADTYETIANANANDDDHDIEGKPCGEKVHIVGEEIIRGFYGYSKTKINM